jgi:hypothetical protein
MLFSVSRTARRAPHFASIDSWGLEVSSRWEEAYLFQGNPPANEAVSDSPWGAGLEIYDI